VTASLAEATEERDRLRAMVEDHVSAWRKVQAAGVKTKGESLAEAVCRYVYERDAAMRVIVLLRRWASTVQDLYDDETAEAIRDFDAASSGANEEEKGNA